MPELETIQVARGDFNTKYYLIEEEGARNRPLNPRKLKSIASNWEDASKDTITLIRTEHGYLIADGQHRIAAASLHFRRPVNLNAMVWERDEIRDFADFITAFNRGTPFTTANLLEVYRDRSQWPALAAREELPVVNQRYRSSHYSWTAIMRGLANADAWRDKNGFANETHDKEALTREYWLAYPEEGIREVVAALKWWYPLAEAAYRSLYRTGMLFSDVAVATAITLYRKYHNQPRKLQLMQERFLASNQMSVLRTMDQKQVRWFVRGILAGMNYRVSKDFVELYGETGKD